jgi:hypothetical protein
MAKKEEYANPTCSCGHTKRVHGRDGCTELITHEKRCPCKVKYMEL